MKIYLLTISITWFIVYHREAKMWQNWLFFKTFEKATDGELKEFWRVKNSWLYGIYQLITCPFCVAFWIAGISTLFATYAIVESISEGFITGLLAVIVCSALEYIKT